MGIYLSLHEHLPLHEGMYISFMLLAAGEPLTLDIGKIHWYTGVLVIFQSLLGIGVLTISLGLLTNFLFSEQLKRILERKHVKMENHIILCGLGNVGFKVLEELEKLNQNVVIIDWGDNKDLISRAQKKGYTILKENLKDDHTLELANISKAKSIIISTSNDLLNMEVALSAREKRPDIRIVLRMFDQHLAQKIRDAFHIRTAFSTSLLAAPVFAAASIDRSVLGSIKIGDEILVCYKIQIHPNSPLRQKNILEILDEYELSILKLVSKEEEIKFPKSNRYLQEGDVLYIASSLEELARLKKANLDEPS